MGLETFANDAEVQFQLNSYASGESVTDAISFQYIGASSVPDAISYFKFASLVHNYEIGCTIQITAISCWLEKNFCVKLFWHDVIVLVTCNRWHDEHC